MRPTALKISVAVTFLLSIKLSSLNAQTPDKINVVTTAVPFLRISPDARAGGMGELSVATSADAASSYFNLGKVPFNELNAGVNVTYTPWLKNLVNDVYLASVAAFYKFDELQAISGSLRYFSLGKYSIYQRKWAVAWLKKPPGTGRSGGLFQEAIRQSGYRYRNEIYKF
jgi:hypothetical protein